MSEKESKEERDALSGLLDMRRLQQLAADRVAEARAAEAARLRREKAEREAAHAALADEERRAAEEKRRRDEIEAAERRERLAEQKRLDDLKRAIAAEQRARAEDRRAHEERIALLVAQADRVVVGTGTAAAVIGLVALAVVGVGALAKNALDRSRQLTEMQFETTQGEASSTPSGSVLSQLPFFRGTESSSTDRR